MEINPYAETNLPLSPYAASKKACEELCYSYHYLYNINILVFRFFTVYGTYGRPDLSIFRFIKWIDEQEPLILYGDGNQERDFTYVGDITEALYKSTGFKGYEILNLGNNKPVKINKAIRIIEKYFNKKAIIRKSKQHIADIPKTCANIQKAKRILKWQPETRIETGLKTILDWYAKEKKWIKKVKVLWETKI